MRAGALAAAAALLVGAGACFDVARTVYTGETGDVSSAVGLWSQRSGDGSDAQSHALVSGLPMTLFAAFSLVLGLALLSGRGSGLRWLPLATAVAGGAVAATTLDELLSAVDTGRLAEGARFTVGAGFWLFAIAMVLAAAAVAVILIETRSAAARQDQPRTALSQDAAVMPHQTGPQTADSGYQSPHSETVYPLSSPE